MREALPIMILFFSTLAFGQTPKGGAYKDIDGLTIVDSISWKDIVGDFSIKGYSGYNFHLDTNMTFQEIDFGCMARFSIDSGSWTIERNNTVALKSNKKTLYFDVIKFNNFYFFIQPTQRQEFVSTLGATKKQLQSAQPVKIDGRIYTVNYLVGYLLNEKYYAKELDSILGEN